MTRISIDPPPVIDSARLLHYAALDESVGYSGRTLLFVGGKGLGPVPCLAICDGTSDSSVLLFHCAYDWTVLGIAEYQSIMEAKSRAEHIYPGLSARWIEANVTKQEAEQYLDELWGEERCSFCRKRGDQIEQMIVKNDTRICDSCILEFHRSLQQT